MLLPFHLGIDIGQSYPKIMVFAEKVIDPLAEELAKEDEFVPNDNSVIEVIISETSSWSFNLRKLPKVRLFVGHIGINDLSFASTETLSFYGSQNIWGWSKFFVPYQKLIYILHMSQTFCPRPKDDLPLVNSVLVPAQKFL